MGKYDGEIRINTNIETEDTRRKLIDLQMQMNKTAHKIETITKKMEEMENAKVQDTGKWKSLQKEIDASTQKLRLLDEKRREMLKAKVPTEEYKEVQAHIESTKEKLNALMEKMEKHIALGKDTNSNIFRSMQIDAEQLKSTLEYLEGEMRDLKDSDQAFMSQKGTEAYKSVKEDIKSACTEIKRLKEEQKGLEKTFQTDNASGIKKLGVDLQNAQGEMSIIKSKMRDVFESQKEINKKGFQKLTQSARKASASMNNLAKEGMKTKKGFSGLAGTVKQMVLSMVVFNVMSKGIEFLKSGLQNLAVYSAEYNRSMSELTSSTSQLKNAFAAAFEPVLNVVIPILSKLIGYVSQAANAVSRFFAILGGKSTYTKAIKQNKDYAASLDKVGGAAKDAQGSLAGFDDLDVLAKKDSGSGGGGAADGVDGSGFIEESVGDTSGFDRIKSALQEIADIFKAGFLDGLGDWQSRMTDIQNKTQMIRDALVNIFTDPAVTSGAKEFAESLTYALGQIAGAAASIGLTIGQNLIGGIAQYLQENTGRIKEFLISMFDIGTEVAEMAGNFAEAFAYVFEAFGSENGQTLTSNLIGIFTNALMGVMEVCARISRDIADLITRPFIENKEGFRTALEEFLGTAAEIFGSIKETVDDAFSHFLEIYDIHIRPFVDSVAAGLSELAGKFLEFWNGQVQPVLDSLAAKFDELMSSHITPMLQQAGNVIGSIADALKLFWEGVLQPLFGWLIENVAPVVLEMLTNLGQGVMTCFGFIADIFTGFLTALQGVIDFIVSVFTGDWEGAWNAVQNIVRGIMDAIKAKINLVMSTIKTIVNSILTKIRGYFENIFQGISDFVSNAMNWIQTNISDVLNGIREGWNRVWTSMKEKVLGIFDGIWSGIKNKINSIISGVEKMANGVINAINGMIEALNSLSFTAPDWVPFIGGETFDLGLSTIDNISIPRLANGGITTGSVLANIGEAGREAVLPLENHTGWMDDLADKLAERMPVYGAPSVVVMELDGKEFARAELPYFNAESARIGVSFG